MPIEFSNNPYAALEDFRRARRRAGLQEIFAKLKHESTDLLSYEEVRQKLRGLESSSPELKDIPVNAIVGSVGRHQDFNRHFLPRRGIQSQRWAKVKMAMTGMTGVPPIEVYQIGDVYFVKDGNHRVSVAREMGFNQLQAYVTKVRTKVHLSANVDLDELILKAEYTDFLYQTRIDELRPGADLTVTIPGNYPQLLEHISVHRYYMGIERGEEISYSSAVNHWYDTYYLPVVDIIRERALLQEFPDRTEADLYLYITHHKAELENSLGWDITAATAAGDIEPASSVEQPTSERAREVFARRGDTEQLPEAARERLFENILVAIDGSERGWNNFTHASLIAQREQGSRLHGLHVFAAESERDESYVSALQNEFSARCQAQQLSGRLAIDIGERSDRICRRARYTDLTVICLNCYTQKKKIGVGMRTLLRYCPRPMLVLSQVESPLDRMLLSYDGSNRAREALCIAAYLARWWGAALTVLTVDDDQVSVTKTQAGARDYLESHGVDAIFVKSKRNIVKAIQRTAKDQRSNLILMGASGVKAPLFKTLGSAVVPVLMEVDQPVLVCR